jgi:hypothetical protein
VVRSSMADRQVERRGADIAAGLRWGQFRSLRPDLAAVATRIFYNFGVGLGFLATGRRCSSIPLPPARLMRGP